MCECMPIAPILGAGLSQQPLQSISSSSVVEIILAHIIVVAAIAIPLPLVFKSIHITRLLWLFIFSILHCVINVRQEGIDGIFAGSVEWEEIDE